MLPTGSLWLVVLVRGVCFCHQDRLLTAPSKVTNELVHMHSMRTGCPSAALVVLHCSRFSLLPIVMRTYSPTMSNTTDHGKVHKRLLQMTWPVAIHVQQDAVRTAVRRNIYKICVVQVTVCWLTVRGSAVHAPAQLSAPLRAHWYISQTYIQTLDAAVYKHNSSGQNPSCTMRSEAAAGSSTLSPHNPGITVLLNQPTDHL